MANRLLIIQPSFYRSKTDRTVVKMRRRPLVPLVLPYLAALTPPGWKISLIDEAVAPVDLEAAADVVAITTWTLNSIRAYDLASEFRKRGRMVILGGPHVYFFPEEAGPHADAIGIGEGESLWAEMLADAASGQLRPVYKSGSASDLKGLPCPRYDLLDLRPYGRIRTFSVQSTRGCPFTCDFCSERLYLGGAFRCRPVPEVIDEIKRVGGKYLFFAESNFGGKPPHAVELMEALIPLKVRWSTLWSMNLCADRHFLDLAQRSGLLHVNIGIESLSPDTISSMKKRQNAASRYGEALQELRRRGISYSLNFIFGWDNDTRDVFKTTSEFLKEHKVPVAYFNVLTPDKGTAYYERMRQANRILNASEIGRWPDRTCHIRPAFCTPTELEFEVQRLYRQFYSLPSMLARLPLPLSQSSLASWALNFSQRRTVRALSSFGNY